MKSSLVRQVEIIVIIEALSSRSQSAQRAVPDLRGPKYADCMRRTLAVSAPS